MPRYSRRAIGRARSARRTNWICPADATGPGSVLNNASQLDWILLDPTDPSSEISKYMSPTLVRIRGNLWVDPIFAPFSTLTARVITVSATIYVADDVMDAATIGASAFYSSDNILYSRVVRFYANADSAGNSVGHEHGVVWGWGKELDIDVKAMRRLEDGRKLILSWISDATSTNGTDVGQLLRCLIME